MLIRRTIKRQSGGTPGCMARPNPLRITLGKSSSFTRAQYTRGPCARTPRSHSACIQAPQSATLVHHTARPQPGEWADSRWRLSRGSRTASLPPQLPLGGPCKRARGAGRPSDASQCVTSPGLGPNKEGRPHVPRSSSVMSAGANGYSVASSARTTWTVGNSISVFPATESFTVAPGSSE